MSLIGYLIRYGFPKEIGLGLLLDRLQTGSLWGIRGAEFTSILGKDIFLLVVKNYTSSMTAGERQAPCDGNWAAWWLRNKRTFKITETPSRYSNHPNYDIYKRP